MKKFILLITFIVFAFSCSEDSVNNNNPYLPNYSFSINVDTSLPSNNDLNYAGNGVLISQSGAGIRGVFVFNTGSSYTAWEATCPNRPLTACSTLSLNGINAKCGCDNELYSLFTGQCAGKEYPLKQYRVEVNGTVIRIFN